MNNKIILLVDDEEDILELLKTEFEEDGYNVLTSSGGDQAYEILKNTKVDFVLSDINMPGGDGPALLDRITREFKLNYRPKMFFMTAFRPELRQELISKGAIDVIFKPFLYQDLIKKITTITLDNKND